MGYCLVLLVGASVTDMGADCNKGWSRRLFLGRNDGIFYVAQVIPVFYCLNMPAVSLKAGYPVFGKGYIRTPFDRNAVIIIQVDDLSETEMSRKRGGLV